MLKGALARWRAKVEGLKKESLALYLAYRDPRTPWATRLFLAFVVAYAFSPLDLIPDFIPILGLLDDALLLPLGFWIALRLIPPPVLRDARRAATQRLALGRPFSRAGLLLVLALWLLGILLAGGWLADRMAVR